MRISDWSSDVCSSDLRVVDIRGISVEAALTPHMLYISNEDKPGFIGALGTTLGDAGVNIATFHLGRAAQGQDAIALLELDAPIDEIGRASCRERVCQYV